MKLLSSEQILSYVNEELTTHRATLKALQERGKTYRSREVTRTVARLNTLYDIQRVIEQPQKNADVEEAMKRFCKTR